MINKEVMIDPETGIRMYRGHEFMIVDDVDNYGDTIYNIKYPGKLLIWWIDTWKFWKKYIYHDMEVNVSANTVDEIQSKYIEYLDRKILIDEHKSSVIGQEE